MKKYEGLFILDTAAKEEGVKEILDKITAEITQAGGKIETTQKMDKRAFARVTKKKHSAGYYVNVIFECREDAMAQLRTRFILNSDVYRVLFTLAPQAKAAAA